MCLVFLCRLRRKRQAVEMSQNGEVDDMEQTEAVVRRKRGKAEVEDEDDDEDVQEGDQGRAEEENQPPTFQTSGSGWVSMKKAKQYVFFPSCPVVVLAPLSSTLFLMCF